MSFFSLSQFVLCNSENQIVYQASQRQGQREGGKHAVTKAGEIKVNTRGGDKGKHERGET